MQPTTFLEPSLLEFFYEELPEDKLFALYHEHGKLNNEGIILPLPEDFDASIFSLDKAAYEYIEALFYKTITLDGRRNELSPGVKITIKEMCENADAYTQTLNGNRFKIILKGGTVFNAIQSIACSIFEAWCLNFPKNLLCSKALLSPSFLTIMRLPPNDSDWVFDIEGGMDEKIQKQLIENAIINPLAKQFKTLDKNPYSLVIKLLKVQNACQKNFYLNNTFKKYSTISPSMLRLNNLCIETFGFKSAVDTAYFSLRTLDTCDCVFPLKSTVLATFKDTLFINITPLLHSGIKASPIRFASLLSETNETIIQALSDRNLLLLTFDPLKPVDLSDFGRTISYFTMGGRCFQKGWLKGIVEALHRGCSDQKSSLSELVKKQLINRVINHHKNEPAILIALTFNASALLYWTDPSYENEIQNLWKLIFTHIAQPENIKSLCLKSDLIETIKTQLQNLNFNFVSLYFFIFQLGSHIDQHSTLPPISYPTQIEGELFTQWRISFIANHNQAPPICALLFPFQLHSALKYINSLVQLPQPIFSHFNSIIADFSLDFAIGQSRLRKYLEDPRRHFAECLDEALILLQKKDEDFWAISFLSVLPFLAQKDDSTIFKLVFDNFLARIRRHWNSIDLRQNCIKLYCRTLKKNGIEIDPEVFNPLIQKDKNKIRSALGLITALVKSGNSSFLECARNFLNVLENQLEKFDYRSLTELYGELIYFSAELINSITLNQNLHIIHSQWFFELIQRSARQMVFLPQTKLVWFIQVYEHLSLKNLTENLYLEEELFEAISTSIEQIKIFPEEIRESCVTKVCIKLINSKNRLNNSFKTICFIRNLLKIFPLKKEDLHQIKQAANSIFSSSKDLQFDDDKFYSNTYNIDLSIINEKSSYSDFLNSGILTVSNDIDKFIFLMNQIVLKESDFKQMCSLLNIAKTKGLKHLSYFQQKNVCKILLVFQNKYGKFHPEECYRIIFDFLNDFKERILIGQILDSLYLILMGIENIVKFNNNVYSEFINYWSSYSLCECNEIRKSPEKILDILDSRRMQREILIFYNLIGLDILHSYHNFRIILLALQNIQIEEDSDTLHLVNVEELLMSAPSIPSSEIEVLKHVVSLIQKIYLYHYNAERFLKAYELLKKEIFFLNTLQACFQKKIFINKSFNLLYQLILSGHSLEARNLSKMQNFAENFDISWQMTFLLMLKNNQIREFVKLMESVSLNEWSLLPRSEFSFEIFNALIDQSHRIAQMQDNDSRMLLISLHEIAHKIFSICKFNNTTLLISYIYAVTDHGPLKIVEAIFSRFSCQFQTAILSKTEKDECRKLFITRLCKEGSCLILDVEKSWIPLLGELSFNTLIQEESSPKTQEFFMLCKGAIKACKSNKIIPGLDDKLRKLMLLLGFDLLDHRIDYYSAKFLSYASSEDLIITGAENITKIFINKHSTPTFQKKAVQLTNIYSLVMLKYNSAKNASTILQAISYTLKNSYSDTVDCIKLLNLLNKIKKFSSLEKTTVNQKKSPGINVIISNNLVNRIKLKLIDKIINNPWIKSQRYTDKDRKIIALAFQETLWIDPFTAELHALILFQQERVKAIITQNDYKKIIKNYIYPPPGLLRKSLINWIEAGNQCDEFSHRLSAMIRAGHVRKFFVMPSEYKPLAMRIGGNAILCTMLIFTIFVVVSNVFGVIFQPKESRS